MITKQGMKMKVKTTVFIVTILLMASQVHAHSLFLSLADIGDNTIELQGMYSTGQQAVQTPVKVYRAKDNKLIWQGETDDLGSCVFSRPDEPYEVELDGGPGHTVREDGI